jgi:hypothetical protein
MQRAAEYAPVFTERKAGEMGKPLSYVLTFLAGLAFGAVAGTIAKPKGKKPSHAKVCGDLKLIHDLEVADSKAASRKADSAAAAEHAKNADYTKDWANKGGCSWAS